MSWRSQRDPEAKNEILKKRTDAKAHAFGRAAIGFKPVPGASADDFVPDRIRTGSLRVGLESTGVGALPVQAPLPNIAFHVEQAPLIRRLLSHRMRHGTAVGGVPRISGQTGKRRIIAIRPILPCSPAAESKSVQVSPTKKVGGIRVPRELGAWSRPAGWNSEAWSSHPRNRLDFKGIQR